IVRGPRLDRRGPAASTGSVGELELRRPDRVLRGVRVALEDVRDEERGLRGQRPFALRLARGPDGMAGGVLDLEDHAGRVVDPGGAQDAVRRGELERLDLDGADRAGETCLEERIGPTG